MNKKLITIEIILIFLVIGLSGCQEKSREIKVTNLDAVYSITGQDSIFKDYTFEITSTIKNTGKEGFDIVWDVKLYDFIPKGGNIANDYWRICDSGSDIVYLDAGENMTKTKNLVYRAYVTDSQLKVVINVQNQDGEQAVDTKEQIIYL